VAEDVVSFVDSGYRTIASARSRGVVRFSSGGMGAWNIVSQNPDIFAAMAVLSGDTFLDMTHKFLPYRFFNSIWPEAPHGPVEGNDWSMTPPIRQRVFRATAGLASTVASRRPSA
jgi:hypothetical protein